MKALALPILELVHIHLICRTCTGFHNHLMGCIQWKSILNEKEETKICFIFTAHKIDSS